MEKHFSVQIAHKKQLQFDLYFLHLAEEIAQNTKCMSRKVGAVLVKDKSIISTGYNGPPRGTKHCNERTLDFYNKLNGEPFNETLSLHGRDENLLPTQCPRRVFGYKSGQGLLLCAAGHAERNALIQAARNGIATLGSTIYCWCSIPCKECMIEIINGGVKRVVYFKGEDYDNYSRVLMKESGIEYEEIDFKLLEKNI